MENNKNLELNLNSFPTELLELIINQLDTKTILKLCLSNKLIPESITIQEVIRLIIKKLTFYPVSESELPWYNVFTINNHIDWYKQLKNLFLWNSLATNSRRALDLLEIIELNKDDALESTEFTENDYISVFRVPFQLVPCFKASIGSIWMAAALSKKDQTLLNKLYRLAEKKITDLSKLIVIAAFFNQGGIVFNKMINKLVYLVQLSDYSWGKEFTISLISPIYTRDSFKYSGSPEAWHSNPLLIAIRLQNKQAVEAMLSILTTDLQFEVLKEISCLVFQQALSCKDVDTADFLMNYPQLSDYFISLGQNKNERRYQGLLHSIIFSENFRLIKYFIEKAVFYNRFHSDDLTRLFDLSSKTLALLIEYDQIDLEEKIDKYEKFTEVFSNTLSRYTALIKKPVEYRPALFVSSLATIIFPIALPVIGAASCLESLNSSLDPKTDRTYLHIAVEKKSIEVIRAILNKKPELADIERKNGDLPLHVAITQDFDEAVTILIDKTSKFKQSGEDLGFGIDCLNRCNSVDMICLIAKKLIEFYIEFRSNQSEFLSKFFEPKELSKSNKLTAAKKLLAELNNPSPSIDNLSHLKIEFPALKQGRLGDIYNTVLSKFEKFYSNQVDANNQSVYKI